MKNFDEQGYSMSGEQLGLLIGDTERLFGAGRGGGKSFLNELVVKDLKSRPIEGTPDYTVSYHLIEKES